MRCGPLIIVDGHVKGQLGKKVKVAGRAGEIILRIRSDFYFKTLTKLQQNATHLEIRAKRNNVYKCNMASSDGFHFTLDSYLSGFQIW